MRIVHVAPFYHPVIGGVETVVKKVAEYMASRGYEVYVVTYNRLRRGGIGALPREEMINGVKVVRLRPTITWSHGTYSTELPEAFRRLKPDIVHVHVWRHPHVFQVARVKEKLGFKTVLHSHAPFNRVNQLGLATWLYHRLADLLARGVLRCYDRVVALTPYEKSVLIQKLGVADEDVVVIPNGIDDELVEKARNFSAENYEPIVLYIGRVSKAKNLDLLVRAMKHVAKELRDVKLVMAGPDEGLSHKLKRYAQKLGINIEYLGTVSEAVKYKLYSTSKVFTHPAYYEPFGITLLEAQAFGKPCVVTGNGGQLYAAPPGRTSLYAKSNPKDYAEAIIRLLTDEDLHRTLSFNARKWAAQHAWSAILPAYERLYNEMLTIRS